MIRRATLADALWFAEQARDYLAETGDPLRYDYDWTLGRSRALLASPDVLALIAPGRGHVLALQVVSLYHPDDIVTRVSTLWVRPEYRGRGLGVRLLRAVERESRGIVLVDSNARLDDAGAMYVRMGYRPVQTLYEKVNDGH